MSLKLLRGAGPTVFTIFLGAVLVSACAQRQPAPAAVVTPAVAPAATMSAADENLHAILWQQTAVEYRGLARQAYRLATHRLDAALADPAWTAATEQQGDLAGRPPAVILDVDETVLDNVAYGARLILRHQEYSDDTWAAWVNEAKAPPIPGAVEFTKYAAGKGVKVFYVTNRRTPLEEATRRNLAQAGFPLDAAVDTVLTRGERGWTASDKTLRRQEVANTHRVLLLVGDDMGDFLPAQGSLAERAALEQKYERHWGDRWIVLPNPSYGSWDAATFGHNFALPRAEKLKLKLKLLDPR